MKSAKVGGVVKARVVDWVRVLSELINLKESQSLIFGCYSGYRVYFACSWDVPCRRSTPPTSLLANFSHRSMASSLPVVSQWRRHRRLLVVL